MHKLWSAFLRNFVPTARHMYDDNIVVQPEALCCTPDLTSYHNFCHTTCDKNDIKACKFATFLLPSDLQPIYFMAMNAVKMKVGTLSKGSIF